MSANDLLFWLSARREGSWHQFRGAVETLDAASCTDPQDSASDNLASGTSTLSAYQLLRQNLEMLGHAEFFAHGCDKGWRVAPPVLAAVQRRGKLWAVLAGARTVTLLASLRESARVGSMYIQANEACPDAVELTVADCSTLAGIAAAAGIHLQIDGPLAILMSAPAIDDPSALVADRPLVGAEWEVARFSPRSLSWETCERSEMDGGPSGLYRVRSIIERSHFLRTRGALCRVNPRVGKFMILKKHRVSIITYDPVAERLTIPAACRPPVLVERALALCSGLPPTFNSSSRLLSYANVSPEIAHLAAGLLRQDIL